MKAIDLYHLRKAYVTYSLILEKRNECRHAIARDEVRALKIIIALADFLT